MSFIAHFSLGFTFSFIGSIPFGMINLTVVNTTIQKGFRAGVILASGAALIEFFQAILAVKFTHVFLENPHISQAIHWLAIPIFWALSIHHFRASQKEANLQSSKKSFPPFYKGIFISSLNMLAIPYWVFYASYFGSIGWLSSENVAILFFCIGIALGAFTLFVVFAKLSSLVVHKMTKISAITNQVLSVLFLIFGVYQLIRMIH